MPSKIANETTTKKPRLTTETVVQRAAELADEKGLTAVTLNLLAQDLGVKTPSLYVHIANRADLIRRLALLGYEELLEAFRDAVAGRQGDAAVLAMGAAQRQVAQTRPGLYEATIQSPVHDDTDLRSAVRRVVEVTVTALRAYDLDEETALHMTRSLRSAVHGFVMLEMSGGLGHLNADATFAMIGQIHIDGLKAQQLRQEAKHPE